MGNTGRDDFLPHLQVFVFRACRMTTQKPVKRRKFNIWINPLLRATKSPVVWVSVQVILSKEFRSHIK